MTGEKGFVAEEALRGYFRSIGYFVVRGIPLNYKKFNVTDVDLWLYVKPTSLTAERTCVDIKHKRTPQAMERVLWTKGLKAILMVDRAIVVTTDNRPETRDFGAEHGIGIMQGDFLQRAISAFPPSGRITEEELFLLLKTPCVVKPVVEWRNWFLRVKAKLVNSLNFDGCNTFLVAAKHLIDEYHATNQTSEVSVRLLYTVIAYFLVCLDYSSRSFTHLDVAARTVILTDGFRYGEAGRQRTEEIVQMALQLLADAGKADLFSGGALRSEFERQVSEYRAEILAEHFAKMEPLKNLFSVARNFEEHAYSKTLIHPHELPSDQKAIIGLISDFLGYDRKTII